MTNIYAPRFHHGAYCLAEESVMGTTFYSTTEHRLSRLPGGAGIAIRKKMTFARDDNGIGMSRETHQGLDLSKTGPPNTLLGSPYSECFGITLL